MVRGQEPRACPLSPRHVPRPVRRVPEALAVLRRWRSMDAATRQVSATGTSSSRTRCTARSPGRSSSSAAPSATRSVDRDVTLRWVKAEYPERWSEATCVQFASKLLSAASEAASSRRSAIRALSSSRRSPTWRSPTSSTSSAASASPARSPRIPTSHPSGSRRASSTSACARFRGSHSAAWPI